MTNALRYHDPRAIQRARAKHLRDLFEPWTYRKLEARTGIGRSTLQSRMTGETARGKGWLPELDSNQQPAG